MQFNYLLSLVSKYDFKRTNIKNNVQLIWWKQRSRGKKLERLAVCFTINNISNFGFKVSIKNINNDNIIFNVLVGFSNNIKLIDGVDAILHKDVMRGE